MSNNTKRYVIIAVCCIWFAFCIFLATRHWAFRIFGAVTCSIVGVLTCVYLNEHPKSEYNPGAKGKKAIIQKCRSLIEESDEETNLISPSCAPRAIEMITAALKEINEKDIGSDIEKEAHILLLNTTYSILQSGEYSFYGSLSMFSGGESALNVNRKCLKWAVKNGLFSEEDAKEYQTELSKRMREVG